MIFKPNLLKYPHFTLYFEPLVQSRFTKAGRRFLYLLGSQRLRV